MRAEKEGSARRLGSVLFPFSTPETHAPPPPPHTLKPMAPLSVGDTFPAPGISLHGATPGDAVDLGALIKGKCVVIASVPGAFTPTCNASHLPGFIESSGDLKEAGADEIIFVW